MTLDRVAGGALAVAAVAAAVWASSLPMTVRPADDAVLRLAWSARPERIERCREQSAEELAKLPAHMRQPRVCEGTTAHYRLTVRVGGRVVADQQVHGGGLRQDRRLYVFRDFPIEPGGVPIEVRFDRVDEAGASQAPAPAGVDAPGRSGASPAGESVPPHLLFAEELRFDPRAVVLITYDPDRQALVARRSLP